MNDSLYISVDLGAGSGRVFLCGLAPGESLLEEIRRFHYPPIQENGFLRWDFPYILSQIKAGLSSAGERARELKRSIQSIGVDSWGVDYGLIDNRGNLLANPVCYRDKRTESMMEAVSSLVSPQTIFGKTGIQFLPFNTLFQLYAHQQTGISQDAAQLLLMPDLINFFLTGRSVAEYTNATTTQMVNAKSQTWDFELIESLGLPSKLLPEIVPAGTNLGLLRPEIADELNLKNVRVIATATHDTASAVAGAPLEKNWAFVSSGTWSLVGVELSSILINEAVAEHNFTNEGGAFGTIRFLKNVMGLWIFETCRKEWKELGTTVEYDYLLREVERINEFTGFIFPDDVRFLNPPQMLRAIAEQLQETGQQVFENPVVITKIILDSLAFRYASVLRTIEILTGHKVAGLQIVGGGARNDYLNQMTANASHLNVSAGLTEATVVGNTLVQAIAAKRFDSLNESRQHVVKNVHLKNFDPQSTAELTEAATRYAQIEQFYLEKKEGV